MVKKEALVLAGPGRLRPSKSGIIPVNHSSLFSLLAETEGKSREVRRLQQGRISKIMSGRGFGFIEMSKEKDIFFHCSDVEGDFKVLEEGDLVTYEVVSGRDGKDKAIKVHKEI